MKRRFFIRRAASFFIAMLIPSLILYALFLESYVENTSNTLVGKGEQTVAAALDNCEVMIKRTAQQNDLLTGTTRMNVSLKRALNQTKMTYGDSVFLTALGSMVRSTIDSNPPLESIMIWLDHAPRLFSSEGSSIQPVDQLKEQQWREVYEQMPPEQRERLMVTIDSKGRTMITSVRRLLLQKGCTVVNIDAQKWTEKLKTYLQREREHLFLINEDGSVLLHATNDKDCRCQLDEGLIATFLTSQSGAWISTPHGRFLITRAYMDRLQVLAVVPFAALTEMLGMLQKTFLAILLVNLGVVMLLAYVTTRRTCNQMMLMIDMLDNAVKGLPVESPKRKTHDEYDVIMNNILYMYLRDVALRNELQQKQYQQEHTELMALQLQINPHFLYNTLQTLEITIRGGFVERLDLCDIIHSISDILKYALSNPQESVTLYDEIHYLKEYAAVQKFRFGGRYVLYYEVDENLMNAEVFRLMLQPLVENCMLHGLKGMTERGYIWVRAMSENGLLHISVKDSGTGMSAEEVEALQIRINDANSRSIGLTNLNRRLILRHGEPSKLRIVSEPGKGTEVSFTIPLQFMIQEVSSEE